MSCGGDATSLAAMTGKHEPNQRCTLWLAELVEDHNVVGVVEVLGQGLDVLSAQSVGHEDSSPVSVRPVDTILEEHKSFCCSFIQRLS